MKKLKILSVLLVFLWLSACESYNKELGVDLDYMYASALNKLMAGDLIASRDQFQKIADEYPYKDEAIEAQVFLIWIYFLDDDYASADVACDAFLKYYVSNQYTDWVVYMKALVAYDQMDSSEKDQAYTLDALEYFSDIYKKYPDTAYQRDASYRIQVIKYNLALRDMNIGYFYLKRTNYTAAISRYQDVVQNYQDTIFIQEAMYRLVYIWTLLGVDKEAYMVASVLGYNYPNSIWYKKSVALIKQYSKIKTKSTKKASKQKRALQKT